MILCCVFILDVQYKTLICYCYFIIMFILDPIWHNTIRRCLVFVCLLCWSISNCPLVLQVTGSCYLDSSNWCSEDDPTTKISCDPELTELTRNHRTWGMLLRSKYCMRSQCCCIWLTCKTIQRYVSFKISIKLCFIGIIITIMSDVLSLVTRNCLTVCRLNKISKIFKRNGLPCCEDGHSAKNSITSS